MSNQTEELTPITTTAKFTARVDSDIYGYRAGLEYAITRVRGEQSRKCFHKLEAADGTMILIPARGGIFQRDFARVW